MRPRNRPKTNKEIDKTCPRNRAGRSAMKKVKGKGKNKKQVRKNRKIIYIE